MKFKLFIIIIFVSSLNILMSQENVKDSSSTNSSDSSNTLLKNDSTSKILSDSSLTAEKDSTGKLLSDSTMAAVEDSLVPPFNPLNTLGSRFVLGNQNVRKISKKDISLINYITLNDILKEETEAYPLFLGNYGQNSSFSFFGGQSGDLSLSFNNRPLTDFQLGNFSIDNFPTEFFESIEVFTGSDAVIFSDNSSGTHLNIQEIRYNSSVPYSKFNFFQGGYELLGGDGIFSQNFYRNWNFTFGFRSLSNNGRYDNCELEAWNLRGILRWNPTDLTSISFAESFTNNSIGTNGGIDNEKSEERFRNYFGGSNEAFDISNSSYAQVIFEGLNQRLFRHDLTLTFNSILDKDTTHAIDLTAFLTTTEILFWSKEDYFSEDSSRLGFRNLTFNNYLGVNGSYEIRLFDGFNLISGVDFNSIQMDSSLFIDNSSLQSIAVFSRLSFSPIEQLNLTGGFRYRSFNSDNSLSYGARLSYNPLSKLRFFLDYSISERAALLSESNLDLINPISNIFLLGTEFDNKNSSLTLNGFLKNISDPIIYTPLNNYENKIYTSTPKNEESQSSVGVNFIARTDFNYNSNFSRWSLKPVNIKTKLIYQKALLNDKDFKYLPEIYGFLRLYSVFNVGNSLAELGSEFEFLSSNPYSRYLPLNNSYVQSIEENEGFMYTLNIFANARLGNAFLKISMNNILNAPFYYVSNYPIYDREFRFTLSWAFVD